MQTIKTKKKNKILMVEDLQKLMLIHILFIHVYIFVSKYVVNIYAANVKHLRSTLRTHFNSFI